MQLPPHGLPIAHLTLQTGSVVSTSHAVQVAIFRVSHLQNGRHRFKVDMNAQQYNPADNSFFLSKKEGGYVSNTFNPSTGTLQFYKNAKANEITWIL